MENNFIGSLLTDMDDVLLREIAEEYAAPFDKEVLFQRSYAKFQGAAEIRNVSRSFFKRTAFRVMTAAACLLLTVGLSVGIWARQQKVETRPPQETQTATVAQTEIRTETTVLVTSESKMTEKQTAPTTKMPETSAALPEVIASDTTAVQTSVITTVETTPERTAPAATLQTASAVIAAPTAPAVTTAPVVTTWHYGTIPPRETAHPAERLTTTIQTTMPMSGRETVIMTYPDPLPGFQISEPDPGNCLDITFKTPVEPSPKQEVTYTLQMEPYQAQKCESGSESDTVYTYEVTIGTKEKATFIVIHVQPRSDFSIRCFAGDTLLPTDVSGFPGVYVLTEERCFLYWDDGLYTLEASGPFEDRDTILEIAQHFKPCETEETETISTESNS